MYHFLLNLWMTLQYHFLHLLLFLLRHYHQVSKQPLFTLPIIFILYDAAAPGPVQSLQATTITSTTISISWVFGGGITENVIVAFAASVNNGSVLVGLVTSFTLVGLQPLTRYTISVVAVNQFGVSSPAIISVETNASREYIVINLCI